jgi:hypothetical protein
MLKPAIHLNGTSRRQLTAEYANAILRLNEAKRALQDVTVHGRDYYILPDNGSGRSNIVVAMDEHADRLARIESVLDEITEIYNAIQED